MNSNILRISPATLSTPVKFYLQNVKNSRGRDFLGIYVQGKNSWLTTLLIVGVIGFFVTYYWMEEAPPLSQPVSTAIMATAIFLIPLWCFLFILKTWIKSIFKLSLGRFAFADRSCLWLVEDYNIWVFPLQTILSCELKLKRVKDKDTIQSAHLNLVVKGINGPISFELNPYSDDYQILVDFLKYIANKNTNETDFGQQSWTEAELANALITFLPGNLNHSFKVESFPDSPPEEIYPTPNQNTKIFSVFYWLFFVAIVFTSFILFKEWAIINRDDALFQIVVSQSNPKDLRLYLLDERNTRHRDPVKNLLQNKYNPIITRIDISNATNKQLQEGLKQLAVHLAEVPIPLVSIRVVEDSAVSAKLIFRAEKIAERKEWLENSLSGKITGFFTSDYLEMLRAPDDTPAHLDLHYKIENDTKSKKWFLHWTFQIRPKIDSDQTYSAQGVVQINEDKSMKDLLENALNQITSAMGGSTLQSAMFPIGFKPLPVVDYALKEPAP